MPEPLLAHRLSKLLYELPDRPREFAQRLEALTGWEAQFADPALAEHRLAQWRKVHSILQSLADGETKKSGGFFKGNAKPDYKGLAEALRKAMPEAVYTDDPSGTMKKKRLRELGTQIVGSPDFLPPAVWNTITRYFEYGDWADGAKSLIKPAGPRRSPSGKPLPKRGGKPKRGSQGGGWFGRWSVLLGICAGSALGLLMFYGWWLYSHPTPAVAENAQGGSEQQIDATAASSRESRKGTPNPKATQAADRGSKPKQTSSDKSKKAPKPPADESDSLAEDTTAGDKQSPTDQAASNPDDSSPDMALSREGSKKTTDTSEATQEAGQTDAAKTADSSATSIDLSASRRDVSAKIPKPAAPPTRAENVSFPPADKFELAELTRSVPASSDYALEVFGPFYDPKNHNDRLFVGDGDGRPNKRPLCRLPERLFKKGEAKVTKGDWLGVFDVSPVGLTFQWIRSDNELTKLREWFCERGFVLELSTGEERLYFALYKPKRPAAIEINSKTSRGVIKDLGSLVEGRALRLGPGKVYFSDETVREFDHAPDGATSVLKPGIHETNAAHIQVHLDKSKNASIGWTMELLLPQNAAKASAETEADTDAPKPEYVSATLYRELELDDGTNVRIDEVIIKEPK